MANNVKGPTGAQIGPGLVVRVKALAKREHRSMASVINQAVDEFLMAVEAQERTLSQKS